MEEDRAFPSNRPEYSTGGGRLHRRRLRLLLYRQNCRCHRLKKPSSETVFGPSQPLGNGTVKTFVTLDDAGSPPKSVYGSRRPHWTVYLRTPVLAEMVMLAFPDQAARTAFNHVMLNWNPQGHEPPELFGKPHFDFHFDMVDMSTMQAINPDDPRLRQRPKTFPSRNTCPRATSFPRAPRSRPRSCPAWACTWSTPPTPRSCPASTTSSRSSSTARGTAATRSSNR